MSELLQFIIVVAFGGAQRLGAAAVVEAGRMVRPWLGKLARHSWTSTRGELGFVLIAAAAEVAVSKPGAPLAPMEPMTSSPSLITTPPPKNMTCGSLARLRRTANLACYAGP